MILMVLRICKHLACENIKSVTLLSRRIKVHVASQDHQKKEKEKNQKNLHLQSTQQDRSKCSPDLHRKHSLSADNRAYITVSEQKTQKERKII